MSANHIEWELMLGEPWSPYAYAPAEMSPEGEAGGTRLEDRLFAPQPVDLAQKADRENREDPLPCSFEQEP